ncbi:MULTISPECIES: hypothetical protein [Kordiimonas]|uniref:hypothetical protein n=1 Tax=Kordiimonas TaxID=288021 RepID=UPI00257CB3D6|nr:hypothetical protein [Kordiimonas sp. UBA4487]
MILRRFMKHVTDQNWVAVGLDVLVVITGIFIGLQVTDWNQARKDAAEGRYFLEFLASQLEAETQDRAKEMAESREVAALTTTATGLLYKESWTDEDLATFQRTHVAVYRFWGVRHRPAALRRLIEGGKLDLITSKDMQAAILKYESAYMEAIQQTNTSYAYSKDITLDLSNHLRYRFREVVSTREELAGNHALQSAFRNKMVMQRIQADVLQDIQAASDELLKTVKDYLEKTEA